MFFASYVTNIHAIPFYSMNIELYHFSTSSTRPWILPFLRELNMFTLQRAKWGLKSSDSSDLMFTRSCQSVYSSSIFLQYSVAIIAMKLSQHTYPGTLITDPTAVCGSVVPLMRVHCLCYSLLSPIWSIVDILWLPFASCFRPKPLGPMSVPLSVVSPVIPYSYFVLILGFCLLLHFHLPYSLVILLTL